MDVPGMALGGEARKSGLYNLEAGEVAGIVRLTERKLAKQRR